MHGHAQLCVDEGGVGVGLDGKVRDVGALLPPDRPPARRAARVRRERQCPRHRVARGVVFAGVGEQVHQRLLRRVLGGGAVEDAAAEAEHERMQAREGRLQGRAISVRDAGEIGAEQRSFIGLHAPLRAERTAGAAPRGDGGGGEGDAGNGQPQGDEGEKTLVHGWLRAGSWARTSYGHRGGVA